MKKLALIVLLSPLCAFAAGDATLRAECAAKNPVAAKPAAANEYQFVYHKGELRGEARGKAKLACSEGQYTQYLASLDPAKVMAANPTAAGKPAVEEHSFSYQKGKLKSN